MSLNNTTPNPTRTAKRAGIIAVRFFLSTPKRPESSIQCEISINADRGGRFRVESSVATVNWSQELQKMLDDSPESKLINERLRFIKLSIQQAALRLQIDGKRLTAKAVKITYLEQHGLRKPETAIEPEKPKRLTFQECFARFYDKKSTNKRKPVSERTKESYWRYKNNLEKYLAENNTKRLYADVISHDWAEKYLEWLNERFENDYANNNVQLIKSVLQFAEDTGIIERNPLKGFKLYDVNEYDTTHLTLAEENHLATFDFEALPIHPKTAQSLREETDCFIISCFTAQHHADLKKHSLELYTHPQDGRVWIRDNRTKTGTPYTLPVYPTALAIIEKYGGIDRLPVKSNVKRNKLLKEIAAFCGISKHLTTKTGRKTFANYALNTMRMREETVAAILGHKTTKFVKHYARITEESIAAEYRF
mgnify:CR=1 FL=1